MDERRLSDGAAEACRRADSRGLGTKERILATAERLFARDGIDATSLRRITAEAGVNLAAVNYHFGSKEGLVREILLRRIKPLNARRVALLEGLEARGEAHRLEAVLECFFRPALELCAELEAEGSHFRGLLARMWTEPRDLIRPVLAPEFRALSERYVPALERCLPGISPAELHWGIFFLVGILVHGVHVAEFDEDGAALCRRPTADLEETLRRMVRFGAAGLRALARDSSGPDGEATR